MAQQEMYGPENRGLATKFDPIYRPRLPSNRSTRPKWRTNAAAEGGVEQGRQLEVAYTLRPLNLDLTIGPMSAERCCYYEWL
jgi:hypothetical protein